MPTIKLSKKKLDRIKLQSFQAGLKAAKMHGKRKVKIRPEVVSSLLRSFFHIPETAK